jgi:hypothetical protein
MMDTSHQDDLSSPGAGSSKQQTIPKRAKTGCITCRVRKKVCPVCLSDKPSNTKIRDVMNGNPIVHHARDWELNVLDILVKDRDG